ncbi:MAG: hypothetical protein EOM36_05775 [Bacteroidia bacterium]|nr:hypothetical protein [Bacteroidia bacterium]
MKTPKESTNVLYAIGGPSVTLEEARGLAIKTISTYINTEIVSSYGSYSAVFFNDIKRTIEEKRDAWVSSKSSSIVLGLQEVERWFDRREDQWWVLLQIKKDDFEKSIKATADEVMRKREQIDKNSNLAVPIIEQLLAEYSTYDYQKRLYSTLECYQTISGFEFAEELMGSVSGAVRPLLTFTESLVNETITLVSLSTVDSPISLYLNSTNDIVGTITISDNVPMGNLTWSVKGMDGSTLASFRPNDNGTFRVSIPGSVFSTNDTFITLLPDLGVFDKVLTDRFNAKAFAIPIQVYQGRYGFSVAGDGAELHEYLKNQLTALAYDKLGFHSIEQESIYPRLVFLVTQRVTDQNQFLSAAQTIITVECQYADGTKRSFQAPAEKGFGVTPTKAKEESYRNYVDFLNSSKNFLQFLEVSL